MKQLTAASSLNLAERLLKSVFCSNPEPLDHFDAVLGALECQSRVLVELPWHPQGQTHLLTLVRREGNRLYFKHTMPRHDASVGSVTKRGLVRRVEADGIESASLDDLRRLFDSGKRKALRL